MSKWGGKDKKKAPPRRRFCVYQAMGDGMKGKKLGDIYSPDFPTAIAHAEKFFNIIDHGVIIERASSRGSNEPEGGDELIELHHGDGSEGMSVSDDDLEMGTVVSPLDIVDG